MACMNVLECLDAIHANTFKTEHAQSHFTTLTKPLTYDKALTATLPSFILIAIKTMPTQQKD